MDLAVELGGGEGVKLSRYESEGEIISRFALSPMRVSINTSRLWGKAASGQW